MMNTAQKIEQLKGWAQENSLYGGFWFVNCWRDDTYADALCQHGDDVGRTIEYMKGLLIFAGCNIG